MSKSYEYIRHNWEPRATEREGFESGEGIALAVDYPYVPRNLKCAYNPSTMPQAASVGTPATRGSSYRVISPSEKNFKLALKDGPIVVALGASYWGSYSGGV